MKQISNIKDLANHFKGLAVAIIRQRRNRSVSKVDRRKRIQLEEERISEIDKAAIRELLLR